MGFKKGTVLICTGFLLIAAAVGLIVYNRLEDRQAGSQAAHTATQLKQVIRPAHPLWDGNADTPDDVPPATEPEYEIPNYVLNPAMDMPEKDIDGESYIGLLEIPALELELPIISSCTDRTLRIAPTRYHGSAYLDNLVLAGHNYITHFGRLRQLDEGDQVIFTDMDGNVFVYGVCALETLSAHAIDQMCSEEWDLTLFTCTSGGSSRITLRCERIEN